jgi:hypothetical protein
MMTIKKNALYHDIEIPKELDIMINKTIEEVNEERSLSKSRRKKTMGSRGIAGLVALGLIVMPLNMSPRIASFANELPIVGAIAKLLTFRSYDFEEDVARGEITIPEIEGLTDERYEEEMNTLIQERVSLALKESKERAAEYKEAYIETGGTEEEYADRKIQVKIDYKVFSSSPKVLSFLVYSHESLAAVYATYDYYNIDMENNRALSLEDLMGSNYREVVTNTVNDYIQDTKDDYGYFEDALAGNWTLREDIDFYVNDEGHVVLVFQKYELASGASGRLEVEISGY